MLRSQRQSEWVIDYIPHEGQREFHLDRYKWRFRLLSGGTGSGKTVAGAFEMIDYLLENDGAVGYVFEPTFPMVKKNLIKQSFERLFGVPIEGNGFVDVFNRTDSFIQLRNGSRLWFGSLDRPESAEGANIDFIMVDEARLIPKFGEAWSSIIRRLRGSVPGKYWNGAYVTTTPNAPGSDLHKFFEDPELKDKDAKVYRMSIYANRENLPKKYIESMERRHTGSYAKAFIHGLFTQVGFGSFAYDSTVHRLESIDMNRIKTVNFGVDFGWTNPTAIVAVGYDGDERAYVLDEFYKSQVATETLIRECHDMTEKWGKGTFWCDSSEPKSIDELRKAGVNAKGARTGKGAGVSREDGIRELGGRFTVAGDGKPRIYVNKRCVKWIGEVMVYDAEVKENDHLVDATRYADMGKGRGEVWVARIDW